MIHFWVSTGMLVGNPSEGPSHFPLELELVSSGSLISASFKGGIPLDTTSIKTANPVVKRVQTHRSSLPRDNCQGQRFGESCYITCREPREESRDGTGNNGHCAGFFVLGKTQEKTQSHDGNPVFIDISGVAYEQIHLLNRWQPQPQQSSKSQKFY